MAAIVTQNKKENSDF